MKVPLQADLAEAQALHADGRLDEAEQRYRLILEHEPTHREGLHLLGLLCHQRGQHDAAVGWLQRAVESSPESPLYRSNLGLALRAQGAEEQAVACFRGALELDSTFAQAHYHLGVAHLGQCQYLEAEREFQRAIDGAPQFREAFYNLGIALQRQGRSPEAIEAYRRALVIDPRYGRALLNLGNELHRQAAWDEALTVYQQLAEVDPASAVAEHMTAALTGVTTAACPAAFVASLFDRWAADYDERMVGGLGYRAPEVLRQLIEDHGPRPLHFARALDLGCGTGLMGRAIRSVCDQLIGVDLSPKMVAEAERAGGYDVLEVADVVTYLEAADEPFDLIVAADVLNYWGDLTDLFSAVARRCASGARFAFTTEVSTDEDVVLTRTGRYRHHRRTIERLAQGSGFRRCTQRDESLRREREMTVAGRLYLFQWFG